MSVVYNISEFAKAIIGDIPIRYRNVGTEPFESGAVDYSGLEVVERPEARRMSAMGTPVVFPIRFIGGDYQYYDRDGRVQTRSMPHFDLPPSSIVSFRRAKIKEKTRLVAAKSSVKETYGHDDWRITITGICFNDESQPQGLHNWQEQKNILLEWEELADSIEVQGELFQDANIFRFDIDEIEFSQRIGMPDAMAFQIRGESDDPRDLFDLR